MLLTIDVGKGHDEAFGRNVDQRDRMLGGYGF
jgi:hypothetical protein